ncbi:hypothetical protein VF21_08201 [Pseudogymnoascus sp. 05NY08]|nr:hypothetical protein VF21_08201 [Pseudogymnoascus sp. 05NY08]
MGALLSLPAVGYLLLPTLGTYSTSLNLLFFYMTWSTLVLTQSQLRVEVIGTLAVRALFFILPAAFFLLFDTIIPSLAVGLKIQGAPALPTRTGGVQGAKKSKGTPPWWQVIGVSLFNILLSVGIQVAVEFLFTEVFHMRSAMKITTTLPMPWSIAKDVLRGLVIREVLQYYIHRFLHRPAHPNTFSTLHKNWNHSITAPYSFTAYYDHPLPYLLLHFLPLYLPTLLFRPHILTHLLLLSLTTLEETLVASGYATLPGIMLGGIARRQDRHMQSRGRGNFAPWGFMDWLHGTSVGGDVMEDVRDEAEKHQVKERAGGMLDDAAEQGREGVREGVKALRGRKKKQHA